MAYYKTPDGKTWTTPKAGSIKVDSAQKATSSNTLKYKSSSSKSNDGYSQAEKDKMIADVIARQPVKTKAEQREENKSSSSNKSFLLKTVDVVASTFAPYNAYKAYKNRNENIQEMKDFVEPVGNYLAGAFDFGKQLSLIHI